jgi:epoxyqueuosine reductase
LTISIAVKHIIKNLAKCHGFDYCGVARAEMLEDDAKMLENWLKNGHHAGMAYMERNFELRVNPKLLVPGAKSVITLLYNYYPVYHQKVGRPKLAKYAYGEDYHHVIKAKMKALLADWRLHVGQIEGRGFVDSAPVLERSWAKRSGLGWIGKNANLINKQQGSFFFIATFITDLFIEPDDVFTKDYCGSCTKCLDACPTEAILPGKTIDSNKCISYHTIELKELLISEDLKGKFDNWIFGCDVCQDVCPWNRFSQPNGETLFTPLPDILDMSTQEWEALSEDAFKEIFKNSAIKRARWQGIRRNLSFIQA